MLPVEQRDNILSRLSRFHFEVSDEVEQIGPTIESNEGPDTLSLSELNLHIRTALAKRFDTPIWVRGEIASHDKNVQRRHLYFELVEKPKGTEQVIARLGAVIFQAKREVVQARLAAADNSITLRDGLEVRLRGRVDYYPPSGRLQFLVEDIDPDFSMGRLALLRKEILDALNREGILTRNLERPWPSLVPRIGLITAANSDAYHDFVRTLGGACFGFEVTHYPVAVQGPKLEEQVLAALDFFETITPEVDLVVIVRGGGARSDLAWFDNLKVARRIARYETKVLIGIGHQRDQSVLDEIAASEKTPTAAAERVLTQMEKADDVVRALAQRLIETTTRRLSVEMERERLHRSRLSMLANSGCRLAAERLEEQIAQRLQRGATGRLAVESMRLLGLQGRFSPRLIRRSLDSLKTHQRSLLSHVQTLARTTIAANRGVLDTLSSRVSAVDPERTLARGFSIVYNADGQVVRRPDEALPGSSIAIRLQQGSLQATVKEESRAD